MKTLLLTGGAGYIGSHTLLALAKTGKYNLVVFDDLQNGNKEAVERIAAKFKININLIQGSLLNKDEIHTVFEQNKIDGVLHFAALIEAGVSMEHPTKFFENNIAGTINLVKAMQSHKVKKLVFSSTAAVYGTPEQTEVTENTPLKPENWYGETKLMMEKFLESLATEYVDESERIDSIRFRYFNAAGSDPEGLIGQNYPKPTHLITVAIEAALGIRDKLTIFGKDYPTKDGTCIRDYIHVSDLADAHVKGIEYLWDFKGTDVMNLGTGQGTSNLEIVEMIEKIHGEFEYEFGKRRPGDPTAFFAKAEKAKDILNWKPKFCVKDAVKDAYNWKKKNPKGFKHLL